MVIRGTDLNLAPVSDPVGAMVLGAHPGNIDTVMVRGEVRRRGGRMVGVDLDRLRGLAAASRDRLLEDDLRRRRDQGMNIDADVIVAGAGPSGLMVAGEVALGGGRVIVLEKRGEPTWARSGTLMPRVMELFASRGLAETVLARAHELHANPFARRGIWAGLRPLDYAALDTEFPYVLMFAQIETERILTEHLAALGGDLRLRSEVLGLDQHADYVEVRYRDPDGTERRLRARWLVGADGSRSVVRQAAGIAFEGTPARRIAVNLSMRFRENPFDEVLTVRDSARRAGR